ncbi:MAG: YabP/YqfC family sporulation protein [Candidatus Limiplasma sp.]|nr:YabP/YqfC family sporulation protein [Candidatus Limiplasma sp.]
MALLPNTGPSGEQSSSTVKDTHTLSIDKRKRAIVTGVQDVFSFQENEVILKIDSGEMVLTGQNLHISKLLLEEGQLHVEGQVDGVLYQAGTKHEGKGRFWKRFFQ